MSLRPDTRQRIPRVFTIARARYIPPMSRNSRWNDAPVLDRTGVPRATRPTLREVEALFPILDRYPVLPANYIHALFGEGSLAYLADRLPLLARRPNAYLRRPPAQYGSPSANYRFQCYAKPETILKDFWHDLGTAMVMASIELGASANPLLELITFDDILRSARTPAATRSDPAPTTIPLPFTFPSSKRQVITIRPDWPPFGIGRGGKYFFCCGIEFDNETEPLRPRNTARSSIVRKFREYLALDQQRAFQTRYGLPHFYYPFVTTNRARMQTMMDILRAETGGQGHPRFLFKFFPAYNSYEKPPAPTGAMLTEPWARAGFVEFLLNRP
jgi:hypothetical protein